MMDYLSDFDYPLPKERIAQAPLKNAEHARLLNVSCQGKGLSDHFISDLPSLIPRNSLLVVNDSKVLPARLLGKRVGFGGSVECFLLSKQSSQSGFPFVWEAMLRTSAKVRPGFSFQVEEMRGEVIKRLEKTFLIGFVADPFQKGKVPLPPYIEREPTMEDSKRYQTVFAKHLGSVAAPTAGLHFTGNLLEKLQMKNIPVVSVTLHVGLGTFAPVRSERVADHVMHQEWAQVSESAAQALTHALHAGKKIICIGTTACRTIESFYSLHNDCFHSGRKETSIFFHPGGRAPQVTSGLLTNFHLPKSTLLMMVSAFAGSALIREAYEHAIERHYRFFSYGDAMLILR